MIHEERVRTLMALGFTPRQASFLILVMLHAGVGVARQYCTHIGTIRGQKSHDFFAKLVALGFATASPTAHHGTWIYHVHGKRLYLAIGEPDHCHRRRVSLGRGVERLMFLDGVLADPKTTRLATAQEKLEHFQSVTSLSPDQIPRRETAHARAVLYDCSSRRTTPDWLPTWPASGSQEVHGRRSWHWPKATSGGSAGCSAFSAAASRIVIGTCLRRLPFVVVGHQERRVTGDQRLLLRPRPPFDFALARHGGRPRKVMLSPHQPDRASCRRPSSGRAVVVTGEAQRDVRR
jgi:hypothetical protein